jgi:hypothetical protein
MPVISPILFYPLLLILAANAVHLPWPFQQTLPQTPGAQEPAKTVSWLVPLATHAILLAVVLALLSRSQIPVEAVGLTTTNWKSAVALAAVLSFIPLSLGVALQRLGGPGESEQAEESRGPLAAWCGLAALSSVSIELWRTFCIASLVHSDLSPWIAVLIVAIAYGSPQIVTSVAAMAGATTFGTITGFLFVWTGSLLAPLTMSLIIAGVKLYRIRRVGRLFLPPKSSENTGRRRYVTCPCCQASFDPRRVERTWNSFTCPGCGELLKYETPRFVSFAMLFVQLVLPPLAFFEGYQGLSLLFIWVVVSPLVAITIGIILSLIVSPFVPPKAEQKLTYGDSGLHLTDRPKNRKDREVESPL